MTDCSEGHGLKECPTNLDPSFDRTPPRNYKCHFCGKAGNHYGPFCPDHPDPNSIGGQRRRNGNAVFRPNLQGPYRPGPPKRLDDALRTGKTFSPSPLPPSRDQRFKRKASRSPSPSSLAPRKKAEVRINREKKGAAGNAVKERKSRAEGRLAYHDEAFRDSLPDKRRNPSPSLSKLLDVGEAKEPVPARNKDAGRIVEAELLEQHLAEMIRTESVKTDMLLFVNGVERLPPYHPSLPALFRGREVVWVNEPLNKTRPCATDYFPFLVEEEPVEIVDDEMGPEVVVIEDDDDDDDSDCVLIDDIRAAGPATGLMELSFPTRAVNGDVEMTDVEQPPTDRACADGADLKMLQKSLLPARMEEGDSENVIAESAAVNELDVELSAMFAAAQTLRIEEPASNEAKLENVEARAIAMPTFDGSAPDGAVEMATPPPMDGEPGTFAETRVIPVDSSPWKTVGVQPSVCLPPRPVGSPRIGAESMPVVVEKPRAVPDESAAEDADDSEMAGVERPPAPESA